ncbi:MAG: EamA/RhaT family transporter, partial [Hyphomicrobiaceae bacterium]
MMQKAVERPVSSAVESGRRLKAIALIAGAVSLFTCLDASAKYVSTRAGIPLLQVVWLRFATQLLLMVMFLGLVRLPMLFVTQKLGHQLVRSCLLAGSTLFNFGALLYLRLDQTTPMLYLMPLMVALLAGPLLGEWVGWRRLLAIIVGFLGVLVVVRPGFLGFHWAFGLAALGTLCYSLYNISTRY